MVNQRRRDGPLRFVHNGNPYRQVSSRDITFLSGYFLDVGGRGPVTQTSCDRRQTRAKVWVHFLSSGGNSSYR